MNLPDKELTPVMTLDDIDLMTLSATVMTILMMDIENGTKTNGLKACGLQCVRGIMARVGKTDEELVHAGFDLIKQMADREKMQ